MKMTNKNISILLVSILLGLYAIFPIVAFAGWTCGEIEEASRTVGVFDNFINNSVAFGTVIFLVIFVPFCLTIWWVGSSLKKYISAKKQHWLTTVNFALSGFLFLILGYIFLRLLIDLGKTALFTPSWVDSDTSGSLLSTCSVITYTMHSHGRMSLIGILLVACLIVCVILAKQVSKIKKFGPKRVK